MERVYPKRINWENEPSKATPIDERNLNKGDDALYIIDGRVVDLDKNKADKSTVLSLVKDVVFDKDSNSITVTKLNGTDVTFQVGDLLDFIDSETIEFNRTGDNVNANIKNGSIKISMLENVLKNNIQDLVNNAITTKNIKEVVLEAGFIDADSINTEYLSSRNAEINYLQSDFANIKTADIEQAKIQDLIIESGWIQKSVLEETYAFELVGKTIKANTLALEELIFVDDIGNPTKNLVYHINELADGLDTETYTEEELSSKLNGKDIIANSVTAEQINVKDVFAQDITATGTISGAKLYGAYGELIEGYIGGSSQGFKITSDGLVGVRRKTVAKIRISGALKDETAIGLDSLVIGWVGDGNNPYNIVNYVKDYFKIIDNVYYLVFEFDFDIPKDSSFADILKYAGIETDREIPEKTWYESASVIVGDDLSVGWYYAKNYPRDEISGYTKVSTEVIETTGTEVTFDGIKTDNLLVTGGRIDITNNDETKPIISVLTVHPKIEYYFSVSSSSLGFTNTYRNGSDFRNDYISVTSGGIFGGSIETVEGEHTIESEYRLIPRHLLIREHDKTTGELLAYSEITSTEITENGVALENKYLKLDGGTITGNLTVNGTITENGVSLEDKYVQKTESDTHSIKESTLTKGSYFKDDGTLVTNNSWYYSDFVFLPNTVSYIECVGINGSVPAICFYDINKNYISGVTYNSRNDFTVPIPRNAHYCRFSISNSARTSVDATITTISTRSTSSELKDIFGGAPTFIEVPYSASASSITITVPDGGGRRKLVYLLTVNGIIGLYYISSQNSAQLITGANISSLALTNGTTLKITASAPLLTYSSATAIVI